MAERRDENPFFPMTTQYETDVDAFTITFRREIVFYLNKLINDQEPVTVMFNDGDEILLTMLLDLDDEQGVLVFDWGGSERVNQCLLKASHAYFVANPVGVRNQFMTDRVRETVYQGRPAFATGIPEKFVRLQRREFFRLTLPISRRIPCALRLGGDGRKLDLNVLDIGLGGVGFEARGDGLPVEIGEVVPGVTIDLGKFGVLRVDLEIRYIRQPNPETKKPGKLGCRFVSLNSRQEHDLQRFITQVQCDDRAKRG